VRTILEIDFGGWNIGVGVKLVIEKVVEELRKSWLTNMNCKIFNCPWITLFWERK
jgi:hypothetical protein